LKLEYRIIQLYSRDAGQREAALAMEYVVRGWSSQGSDAPRRTDAAPRGEPEVVTRSQPVSIAFDCSPSHDVTFRVIDENGKPTTAAFVIRDPQNRVYPSQAKRLAPDFAFHPQFIERSRDGETAQRGVHGHLPART